MTHDQFIDLLDSYFRHLTRAMHVNESRSTRQAYIDEARLQIIAAWTAEASNAERLARAGDVLAHGATQGATALLVQWWAARNGHDGNCTVCPRPPVPVVEVMPSLPVCKCTCSDAWRCAVEQKLTTSISCHCQCHRSPSAPRPRAA